VQPRRLRLLHLDETENELCIRAAGTRAGIKLRFSLPTTRSPGPYGVYTNCAIATPPPVPVLPGGVTISIRGHSYGLEEELKAGLFDPTEANA